MKKVKNSVIFFIMLSMLISMYPLNVFASTLGANLVPVSGFEGSWQIKQGGTLDTSVKHSGNQSLRLDGTTTDQWYGSYTIKIDATQTYRLSAWIKTSNISTADGASVNVQMLAADGSTFGWLQSTMKTIKTGGTQDWTQYSADISGFHPDTASVRIYVRVSANVTGSAWFDDISLQLIQDPIKMGFDGPPSLIFQKDKPAILNLSLQNVSDHDQSINIDYTVKDYDNKIVNTGSTNTDVKVNSTTLKEVDFSSLNCGVYRLEIHVTGDNGKTDFIRQTSFSKIIKDNSTSQNDILGVNTHFGRWNKNGRLPVTSEAGIKWIRDGVAWSLVEKTKGQYSVYPEWEQYVDDAVASNRKVMATLFGTNPLYDGGNNPYTDAGIAAYASYCGYMAEHFKGKVDSWEIWNEYNTTPFNPQNQPPEVYAKMLKAAYQAIKAANPNATVIAGGTAHVPLDWIQRVLDAGGYDYMDAFSIHPYCFPASPDASFIKNMQDVHNLIKKYGQDKPVWVTEIGWPTHTGISYGTLGVSEKESGSSYAKTYVLGMSNSVDDKIFWYDLQDDGLLPDDREQNFGLIKFWYGLDNSGTAKANYVAAAAVAAELDSAQFVSANETDNARIYKFHRTKDNKDVLAIWTLNDTQNIGLHTGSNKVTYTDVFGNSQQLASHNGIVSLTASNEPVYLEGIFPDTDIQPALFDIKDLSMDIVKGDSLSFTVSRVQSLSDLTGTLDITLPEGWALIGDTDFKAGEVTKEFKVIIPDNVDNGKYNINIIPKFQNEIYSIINLTTQFVLPISAQVKTVMLAQNGSDNWGVNVSIRNNSGEKAISGTVAITSPAEIAAACNTVSFSNLAPKQEQSLTIPIPNVTENNDMTLRYRVTLDSGYSGYSQEFDRRLNFLSAMKAQTPPVIDGTIDSPEWDNTMPFNISKPVMSGYKGDQDISAKGWLKWDSKNIYLAVKVKDDVHYQASTYSDIWRGDSIQLAIDPKNLAGQWNELGLALANNGQIYAWRWTGITGKPAGELKNIECKIVRDQSSTTTNYEAAIPWSELLPEGMTPSPETLLGFSILVNDNDGNGRKGWIEYMDGIGSTKDSSLFGDLFLTDINLPQLDKVTLSVDRTNLKPGDLAKWSVSGTAKDGSTVDLSQAQIVIASDNEQVAKVDTGSQTITALSEGTANIKVTVTLGGVTKDAGAQIIVDNTPPATTLTIGENAANNWYTSDITMTLNAADNLSGVDYTEYRIGTSGDWITYTAPFTITQEGASTVQYRSYDKAGNVENLKEKTAYLDKTAPVTIAVPEGKLQSDETYNSDVSLTLTASDSGSGVAKTLYSLDGTNWLLYSTPVILTNDGLTTVSFSTYDVANNVEVVKSIGINVNKSPDVLASDIIKKIDGMDLEQGIQSSLTSKLDNIIKSFINGNLNSTVNQLNACINEVSAQSGKKFTIEQANELKAAADKIIAKVNKRIKAAEITIK